MDHWSIGAMDRWTTRLLDHLITEPLSGYNVIYAQMFKKNLSVKKRKCKKIKLKKENSMFKKKLMLKKVNVKNTIGLLDH